MPRMALSVPAAPMTVGAAATGTVAGGAITDVSVPLDRAQPDTNYTPVVSVEDGNAALTVRAVKAKTTTAVTVRVVNTDTLTGHSGTVRVAVVRG
jgi:hypothetical protein